MWRECRHTERATQSELRARKEYTSRADIESSFIRVPIDSASIAHENEPTKDGAWHESKQRDLFSFIDGLMQQC